MRSKLNERASNLVCLDNDRFYVAIPENYEKKKIGSLLRDWNPHPERMSHQNAAIFRSKNGAT